MKYPSKIWWGVALICLIAFIVIAVLSEQVFEYVPHSEDEVAYVFQAKVFAQNRLTVPTPALKGAFWSPFVVDYEGQRFGKYSPGWPLLLSLGMRLNKAWLVNAVLATLTLAMMAGLGQLYYYRSQEAGVVYLPLLVAGLGLLTPGFLFLSSSLLSHPGSLFWVTVALVSLYGFSEGKSTEKRFNHSPPHKKNQRKSASYAFYLGWGQNGYAFAILMGVSLGTAFITRPFAALGIGLAVGIFLLTLVMRGEIKGITLGWVVLGGLPIAALLPLYWGAISGQLNFNAYLLVWPYDRVGFGPDIGPHGYTLSDALFINTRLKLIYLGRGLFGWPGWSNLIFIPISFLTGRANRWDWLLLGTIGGMIIIHIFYWAFGGVDGGFPRYYYDALPALLLLTARGIQIASDILSRRKLSLFKRGIKLQWLLVWFILAFIGYNFIFTLPPLLAAQKGKYNITPAPLQAVEHANLGQPVLIIVKNIKTWSDFAAPFSANSPTLDGPIIYAMDQGPEYTRKLRQQFSKRSCWELEGESLSPCKLLDFGF